MHKPTPMARCFDCWCGFVSHDSYANKLRGYLAGGAKLDKVCKAMGYLLKDIMPFLCVLAKHLR